MNRKLPNYLRTHRKRWALTQEELALLFGLAGQATVSHYELHTKRPSTDIFIASEIIFGVAPRELFSKAYGEVEDAVMRRAKLLHERLEARTDLPAELKLRLLSEMIRRAEGDVPNV